MTDLTPLCPEGFLGFHAWDKWGPLDKKTSFAQVLHYQDRTCKLCGVVQRRFV